MNIQLGNNDWRKLGRDAYTNGFVSRFVSSPSCISFSTSLTPAPLLLLILLLEVGRQTKRQSGTRQGKLTFTSLPQTRSADTNGLPSITMVVMVIVPLL